MAGRHVEAREHFFISQLTYGAHEGRTENMGPLRILTGGLNGGPRKEIVCRYLTYGPGCGMSDTRVQKVAMSA